MAEFFSKQEVENIKAMGLTCKHCWYSKTIPGNTYKSCTKDETAICGNFAPTDEGLRIWFKHNHETNR